MVGKVLLILSLPDVWERYPIQLSIILYHIFSNKSTTTLKVGSERGLGTVGYS